MSKGTGGPSGDEAQNLVLTPPDDERIVVSALTQHLGLGGPEAVDALGGHLVEQEVFAFAENQRAELRTSDIALQLNSGGGKPGQGYGAVFERGRYAVHNGDDVCVSEDQALSVTASKGNPGAITDIGMVRKLTPTECERLQGFPDGWTDTLSDTRRYRALGNAVSVPVVDWLARRMADVHQRIEPKGK